MYHLSIYAPLHYSVWTRVGSLPRDCCSTDVKDAASAAAVVGRVGAGLLAHGVTAFCPTVVTSPPATYHASLPHIRRTQGGTHGATVLGVHVEGPFIRWRGS